jgi:hypothetical protein
MYTGETFFIVLLFGVLRRKGILNKEELTNMTDFIHKNEGAILTDELIAALLDKLDVKDPQ